MKCVEYGNEHKETVMLLHGGGLSWWNYRDEAEMLRDEYHVILPILDGHAGSDRPFTSIESNAGEIVAYIDEHLGGSVKLIGGLSLGGQVLLEMLSRRGDICRHAFVESAMAIPSKMTHALVGPAFGMSWGLIRNRRFAAVQFRSLHIRPELFENYYRDTCAVTRDDMIAFMRANTGYSLKDSVRKCQAETRLFVGEKETRGIRRSAALMQKYMPDWVLTVLPGYRHGDLSINHAGEYVQAIREALANERTADRQYPR